MLGVKTGAVVMVDESFGEGVRKSTYAWPQRLLYGNIMYAVLAVLLLAVLAAWVGATGSVVWLSLAIGLAVGMLLTVFEYFDVGRRSRAERVEEGGKLVVMSRLTWDTGFVIAFIGSIVMMLAMMYMSSVAGSYAVWSFLMGFLTSLGVMLPTTAILLESKFGKLYVVQR